MSGADDGEVGDDRGSLRARLEWLQLLGVDHLAVGAPSGPPGPEQPTGTAGEEDRSASPSSPARGGQVPAVQTGLFGGAPAGGAAPPVRGDRQPTREPAHSSPLATAEAPDAPDATTALELIRREIGDCTRCKLSEARNSIVFGVGDPNARLMFIGEGPGADEDRKGEPFVGRAGQLLTKIIEAMGLTRESVYIANVVKCRPPENRTPLPDEIGTCSPFLFRQAAAIRPRVVVCLGTPATQTVLGMKVAISRVRGVFQEVNGILIMPTFHPAYLLRNPAAKKEVWEDMKQVMALLKNGE